jgi:hypothetical protein
MINLWGPVNAEISIPNRPAFYDAGLGVHVWQPTGSSGPALSLDFLSGSLDSRITYSGASQKTMYDSTGKLTYAPNNLVLQSQTFNTTWTTTNCTVTPDATTAPDGTLTADKIVGSTSALALRNCCVSQIVGGGGSGPIIINSVYAKADNTPHLVLYVDNGGGVVVSVAVNLTTGVATAINYSGVSAAPEDSITVGAADAYGFRRISFRLKEQVYGIMRIASSASTPTSTGGLWWNADGDGTKGIYIWGAQYERTTYQTVARTYNATTAAAYYGPRFDYDPVTLAARGLLIEESRTNGHTYSDQFETASWTKTNVTITANAVASPDGTTNADKIVETATSAFHIVNQNTAFTGATPHTASYFVKAAERGYAAVQIYTDGITKRYTANVDLATGAITSTDSVGSPVSPSAVVTPAPDGFWRIAVTATNTSGIVGSLIAVSDSATPTYASGCPTYLGDITKGIYVYGAQLEAGSFATSYIPTTTASVTRAADSASMTGTNFSSWYNQSEGTFVAGFAVPAFRSNVPRVLGFDLQATATPIYIASATQVALYNGATTVVTATGMSITANNKASAAYVNGASSAIVVNGGTVVEAATDYNIGTPAALYIGDNGGASWINGHIQSITYYNTRLPNATLQSLTA